VTGTFQSPLYIQDLTVSSINNVFIYLPKILTKLNTLGLKEKNLLFNRCSLQRGHRRDLATDMKKI